MSRNLLLFSLFLHACVQESAPQQSSDSGAEALVDLNSPQEELGVQLDEGLHIEADEGEDLGEDLLLKPDLALTPDIALEPDVASFACADGLDNDGDGRVDLEDSDCANVVDNTENGADPDTICSNGLDDDEDGLIDFPFDPGCAAAGATFGSPPRWADRTADRAGPVLRWWRSRRSSRPSGRGRPPTGGRAGFSCREP